MSRAAVDTLGATATVLRGAMESGDPEKMVAALERFVPALDAVRAVGAWHANDELKALIRDLRKRLESDQSLARLLGDLAQQQLDRIAGAAPDTARHVYRRF